MDTHKILVCDSEFSKANFLSLDQPCLEKIISYLDSASFHSLLLTCKQLSSLLPYTSSKTWSNCLLYRKGLHLLQYFVFTMKRSNQRQDDTVDQQLFAYMSDILTKAIDGSNLLKSVTPKKITEIWNRSCPLMGRLHSLVISYEDREDKDWLTSSKNFAHKFITLELPSGRHLKLWECSYKDGTWVYDDTMAVKAVLDSHSIIYNENPNNSVFRTDSCLWQGDDEAEESDDISCLNLIGNILEKEIGEVDPSGIDGELIIDFLHYFPRSLDQYSCSKRLKNEESNKLDLVSLTAQYLKKQKRIWREFRNNLKLDICGSSIPFLPVNNCSQTSECRPEGNSSRYTCKKQDETDEASSCQMPRGKGGNERQDSLGEAVSEFGNILSILMVRGDHARLKALNTAFKRFKAISHKLNLVKLQGEDKMDEELFRCLLFRVNFGSISGNWSNGLLMPRYVECKMDLKLCGPHVISFSLFNYESVYFTIPSLNTSVRYKLDNNENDFSWLSSVTTEIQKCIDKDCPIRQCNQPHHECPKCLLVPGGRKKVTDEFVVAFFISVTDIHDVFDINQLKGQHEKTFSVTNQTPVTNLSLRHF